MRILSFPDGFTSSSAPLVEGAGSQENFVINNNATAVELLTIDSAQYKTYFMDYELIRQDVGGTYVQQGGIILGYDGSDWVITFGNYQGVDLVQDSTGTIDVPEKIKLYVSTTLGVCSLKYDSGAMGGSYAGELKLIITRVAA